MGRNLTCASEYLNHVSKRVGIRVAIEEIKVLTTIPLLIECTHTTPCTCVYSLVMQVVFIMYMSMQAHVGSSLVT